MKVSVQQNRTNTENTLYTVHAVYTVHTVQEVHTVHTVHTVNTLHTVHAVMNTEQKPWCVVLVGCEQCLHPTTQRPTTATNHIQQNQNNTPNAVTVTLIS